MYRSFSFSAFSSTLIVSWGCCCFNSHPNECELSHCGFYLYLFSDVKHLFLCSLAIWVSSLEKSLQTLCPFFNKDGLVFFFFCPSFACSWVLRVLYEWLRFHFALLCIREGNGNPPQCSCLENPRDGVAQSQIRLKWLSSSSSSYMS